MTTQAEITTSGSDLVTFDESPQVEAGTTSDMNALVRDVTPSVGELADFLSRPVRISTRTWNESDSVGFLETKQCWYEFLNTAFIKKKLDNYAFIRGNLHLKVVVNASPFYYGLAMLSYNPTPAYHGAGAGASGDADYTYGLMQRSQRPHIMIIPQESLGGELKVPFIWNKNWAQLTSASEIQGLGSYELEVIAQLQSAKVS